MSGNLGFGMMRLPRRGLAIDVKQTSEMVDIFLDAGFTYFDTAFIYPGSEDATRRALVERYPRERYTLATKLFAAIAPSEKAAKKELETSLQRTGAGYIDYYLLHSLMEANYRKYERFHLWEFAEEEKRRGRLRHIGYSFHGGPALLETLLTEHRTWISCSCRSITPTGKTPDPVPKALRDRAQPRGNRS
jgi:predicted aldo/keto reductase-like oxidoreductase